MAYNIMATSTTPALVIYLLDISGSMGQPLGNQRRIDVVMDALSAALRQMVFRSTKGGRLSPRYRIAMYAYSDQVYDLLDGIKPVDHVAQLGVPDLNPQQSTDTAKGFGFVATLLQKELFNLRDCPAPLVCHMTDGEFTGNDPEPAVRQIMAMAVPDGNVLVENIFISDNVLSNPIHDPRQWQGIMPQTPLLNGYAAKLRAVSSPLPESYRMMMAESDYSMAPGALMLLPGMSTELVEMAFVMSTGTGFQISTASGSG